MTHQKCRAGETRAAQVLEDLAARVTPALHKSANLMAERSSSNLHF